MENGPSSTALNSKSNTWTAADSTDDPLCFGDCIVINTTGKEVNLMNGDAIDMFIVHTPSEQVIQKTALQTVLRNFLNGLLLTQMGVYMTAPHLQDGCPWIRLAQSVTGFLQNSNPKTKIDVRRV